MPRDRLPLSVRVGCKIDGVGFGDLGQNGFQMLFVARFDCPIHCEIFVGAHGAVFGGQIANVSETGDDAVIAAQIFVDCFRFCGRFDDDDFHIFFFLLQSKRLPVRQAQNFVARQTFDFTGKFQLC